MHCFATKNIGHKSDGRICYKNFYFAHQINGLFEGMLKAEEEKNIIYWGFQTLACYVVHF